MSAHSLDEKDIDGGHAKEQTVITTVAQNADFAAAKETHKLKLTSRDSLIILASGFVSYMCAVRRVGNCPGC